MSKKSRKMAEKLSDLAKERGLTHLCEQEKRLIDLLHLTTFHGRNLVIETAIAMRRIHPWVWLDGISERKSNTETAYPATDCRFFNRHEED